MAKIKDPILFSRYFGIENAALENAGLIDPFVDVDLQLFIDPVLLEKSSHEIIRTEAVSDFRAHFENLVRLLDISEIENDVAWRGARKILDLREPPENGLGYGGSGRSGSSRPDDVQLEILRTSKDIIRLGAKDPEMISLMGFFEDNVGPDTISDLTTRAIIEPLSALTENFCSEYGIPLYKSDISERYELPKIEGSNGKKVSIVLVPKDIVRDLPVANDWSDIERAAFENKQIRERVNALLSSIIRPTVADRKSALRAVALESADTFQKFLATVKEHVASYDPNLDALGYYKLQSILAHGIEGLVSERTYDLAKGADEVRKVVLDSLSLFKHHVEKGNLWEELWLDSKPKKERAAQLIYYAIADSFCRANNVDISPEANMGGGPVDFKFSKGYTTRVLVELKRSGGSVVHGYEKQLEIYKDASRTQFGIFVVIDFGDLGSKYEAILKIQASRRAAGVPASDIIVIDASQKVSASKRQSNLLL